MTPEAVQQLLEKYVSEELSHDEFVTLWQTLSEEEHRLQWETKLDELLNKGGFEELASPQQQEIILASILHQPAAQAPLHTLGRRKIWWAAASVIMMLAIGGYFLFIPKANQKETTKQMIIPNDLPPGKEGAILTLAGGEQLVLDTLGDGVIASENGAQVLLHDNAIRYTPGNAVDEKITYNTLSTPNGRMFHVQLPDGTLVWLNAASSVRYPTKFDGNERKVSITGEVYFEVMKDMSRPFIVDVNGKMDVQVLGTSFNVNAYANEPSIRTTLLEGSIKVVKEKETGIMLSPGQQAISDSNELKLLKNPDLTLTMAWKDGYFIFNNTPVKEILRQFSRWYDMDVVYEQKAPDFALSGAIRRDFTLTEALMTLEKMGLRYRLEGKRLIVLPSSL